MATGREIVTSALKLLGVVGAGEVPAEVDVQEGLAELNRLAFSWDAKNVHTGWLAIGVDDEFPLEPRHEYGVIALLAECLQASYGNPLTPYALQRARAGWNLLFADYHTAELLQTDEALQDMGPFQSVF